MVSVLEKTLGIKAVLKKLPVPPGDVKLTWADISKAQKVLGYKPDTPFDKGIEKFVSWFNTERRKK